MTSKNFPLSVVISTLSDRLLACSIDEYRAFLSHTTGTTVDLWDLTPARLATIKALHKQHPELKTIPALPEKTDSGNANKYVRACARKVGLDDIDIAAGVAKYRQRSLSTAIS